MTASQNLRQRSQEFVLSNLQLFSASCKINTRRY